MQKVLGTSLLLMLGAALASPAQISTQSIIVNPVNSPLNVSVWVDKNPAGGGNPTYQSGEALTVSVETNQDAYVYLFDVNAAGHITLISPNGFEDSNFVSAGVVRSFPGENPRYKFTVKGPEGQDKLLALASLSQLDINDIANFAGQQGFARVRIQGQQQLAQALSVAVNPLDPNDWTTDTARFRVNVRGQNPGEGLPPLPSVPPVQTPPAQQPTAPVQQPPAQQPQGQIQPGQREGGSIDSAIADAWDRTGGNQSLGQATSYVQRWGNGYWQKFAGVDAYGDGVILHADGSSRAYAVHGKLLKRYLALAQAENGATRPPVKLGWAAGDEKVIPRNSFGTSGLYGFFQYGALYGTDKYGTFWLNGDLLKKYQGLGGSGSFLGFPTRDPYSVSGHLAADFEGGSIRWYGNSYAVYRK